MSGSEASFDKFSIVLPVEYPLVLLSVSLLCLECWFIGMFISNYARHSTFTEQFMDQFKEEHEAAIGKELQKGGFPDCGEGRYAEKLSYEAWLRYGNFFRAHNNFVEQLPVLVAFLVFAGLFLPKITMWVGFINVVSRIAYTASYICKGPNWRVINAFANLCIYGVGLVGFIMAIIKAF